MAEEIAASLSELGYAVSTQGDSIVNIAERIGEENYKIALILDQNGKHLVMSCQVDTLARAGETADEQRDYLFNALDINDTISPFSTSLITPKDDQQLKSDDAPLVMLVRRINLEVGDDYILSGDLITHRLREEMQELRRAVLYFNQHVRDVALQPA